MTLGNLGYGEKGIFTNKGRLWRESRTMVPVSHYDKDYAIIPAKGMGFCFLRKSYSWACRSEEKLFVLESFRKI
jgi:hypothetical protein